jgi:hypothetical protein
MACSLVMPQDQTWLGPVATSSGLTVARWVAWRCRSRVSPGLAPHPVVGGDGAEVGALVQQGRPDFVRGQISEPPAVQRVQDRLPWVSPYEVGDPPQALDSYSA